ncbi:hypothetical protein RA280_33485, partial [Cupriavidus sp. CV2]|uniref:hypothetical protein n=1 Tax=Cupriavidus ulmosensis TaxID=3065913 RepID=UPI00296DEFD5|nr:hypothetical protein [Cupriavidus sp. CV2]
MTVRKLSAVGLVAMALAFTGASAQQMQESKGQQGAESTQIPKMPSTAAEAKDPSKNNLNSCPRVYTMRTWISARQSKRSFGPCRRALMRRRCA